MAIPTVEIHTWCPSSTEISAIYVEEFLHWNITELLKNAMRATCEVHQPKLEGNPWTLAMGVSSTFPATSSQSSAKAQAQATARTAKRSMLPPIRMTLVQGEEDVSIKITDEGGGFALSELDRIWSFAHASQTEPCSTSFSTSSDSSSSSSLPPPSPFKISMGRGLPLARLIARYFGGDLTVVPLEGHGTDSYLSLCRNDDHLENFPELADEMLDEVDVFVDELRDSSIPKGNNGPPELSVSVPSVTTTNVGALSPPPSSPSLPASTVLGLGKTSSRTCNSAAAALLRSRRGPFLPPTSTTPSQSCSPAL